MHIHPPDARTRGRCVRHRARLLLDGQAAVNQPPSSITSRWPGALRTSRGDRALSGRRQVPPRPRRKCVLHFARGQASETSPELPRARLTARHRGSAPGWLNLPPGPRASGLPAPPGFTNLVQLSQIAGEIAGARPKGGKVDAGVIRPVATSAWRPLDRRGRWPVLKVTGGAASWCCPGCSA